MIAPALVSTKFKTRNIHLPYLTAKKQHLLYLDAESSSYFILLQNTVPTLSCCRKQCLNHFAAERNTYLILLQKAELIITLIVDALHQIRPPPYSKCFFDVRFKRLQRRKAKPISTHCQRWKTISNINKLPKVEGNIQYQQTAKGERYYPISTHYQTWKATSDINKLPNIEGITHHQHTANGGRQYPISLHCQRWKALPNMNTLSNVEDTTYKHTQGGRYSNTHTRVQTAKHQKKKLSPKRPMST